MKTLILMLVLLESLVGFAQEFQFATGINRNMVLKSAVTDYLPIPVNGYSSSLSMLNYYKDTIPYRLTLIQENYFVNVVQSTQSYRCDRLNVIDLTSEIHSIGFVFYPLVLKKGIFEFDFGFQFSTTFLVNASGYYGCESKNPGSYDITSTNTHKWLHLNNGGLKTRFTINIPFEEWKIVPQYTTYFSPLQEAKDFSGNSTLRHFFGLGVSHSINFKSQNE